ncbi:TPA: TraV family lipoprotein, partial [Salmonella enterica subsp. enterica serovar Dublin]|nr:TraV family lipoprotein [Salmonella enterica]HAF7305042.1 TraV family lipoprotein [Salmonella enterica subsp. enterica serovar Dublin]
WEDTNGDLIVTGYVYTEIEPRRWVIGDGTPQSEPVLRPLQTVQHEPKSETTK